MTNQYDRKLTTAEELFWNNMKGAQDGPTTRTKIEAIIQKTIMPRLAAIETNTAPLPKFFKVVRNLFAKGVGDLDEHVLDKKK